MWPYPSELDGMLSELIEMTVMQAELMGPDVFWLEIMWSNLLAGMALIE